jgi:hypothetical protein
VSNNKSRQDVKHYIGELYGGGIIFYIDDTGNHGKICSISDLCDHENEFLNYLRTHKEKPVNSITINSVKECCHNYANPNCHTGIFNDWYLPTLVDLQYLYSKKNTINKTIESCDKNIASPLLDKAYWSTTMNYDYDEYYCLELGYGALVTGGGDNTYFYKIRAIRNF